MLYHFFAYMSRMKHIKRWALMRNTWQEDIAQHSLQVAMIAHALAVLRNERFGGGANPERAMALAVYHEAPEVITGDMATPIKYFNPGIRSAYKEIEGIAADKLHSMLPDDLRPAYAPLLLDPERDPEWRRVKAADKLSAYIKCIEELNAGNREFSKAADSIRREIDGYDLPEVQAEAQPFSMPNRLFISPPFSADCRKSYRSPTKMGRLLCSERFYWYCFAWLC